MLEKMDAQERGKLADTLKEETFHQGDFVIREVRTQKAKKEIG